MAKLRMGVVGAGGIAQTHLKILARWPDRVEIVGIADIRLEAAQAAAEKYGALSHTANYRDLWDSADAILVCVPTHLHAGVVTDSLRAGKHVFCEKPMARTLDQAQEMAHAARDSGKCLQIGFVRRFDDEWLAIRETVRRGGVGRPVLWRHLAAGPGPAAPWYNTDDQGGGPFLDGCIHNLDFALYMFGPAEWVFAHLRTFDTRHTALDTGTATLRFQSGDELLLAWSWGLAANTSGARVFEFLGPEGVLTWPRDVKWEGDERHFLLRTSSSETPVLYPANALGTGYARQMDEFVRVCQGEGQPRAGVSEGIESLKLALAILESGRTSAVVRL